MSMQPFVVALEQQLQLRTSSRAGPIAFVDACGALTEEDPRPGRWAQQFSQAAGAAATPEG